MADKINTWFSRQSGCQYLSAEYIDQEFSPHFHESYVIGTNIRGEHKFGYKGSKFVVPSDTIAIIHPGEIHTGARFVNCSIWVYRSIYPDPSQLAQLAGLDDTFGPPHFKEPVINDRVLAKEFSQIHFAVEQNGETLETQYCKKDKVRKGIYCLLLRKTPEMIIMAAIICLEFNVSSRISQPSRIAVTGIRLINMDALDA